jgi:hypothetical protein
VADAVPSPAADAAGAFMSPIVMIIAAVATAAAILFVAIEPSLGRTAGPCCPCRLPAVLSVAYRSFGGSTKMPFDGKRIRYRVNLRSPGGHEHDC